MKIIGLIVIALCAVVTLGVMYSTMSSVDQASDAIAIGGFVLWVMLPFAVMLVLTLVVARASFSRASRTAALVVSLVVSVASTVMYAQAIFDTTSSTSALVFVILPLYSLAAIPIGQLVTWLIFRALISDDSRPG